MSGLLTLEMLDKRAQDRILKAKSIIADIKKLGAVTPKLQRALQEARDVIAEELNPATQKSREQLQLDARESLAQVEGLIHAANRDPLKNAELLEELQKIADETRDLIC